MQRSIRWRKLGEKRRSILTCNYVEMGFVFGGSIWEQLDLENF